MTNQFGNDTLRVLRPIALCLPTGKSVTTTYPAIPTGLGHYLCYSIQDLTPRTYSPVILVDQFGTQQSKVIRPVALCAPVRKTYQGKANGVHQRHGPSRLLRRHTHRRSRRSQC